MSFTTPYGECASTLDRNALERSVVDPIRWGILATGTVAHLLAEDLAQVRDAELVAVGSRSLASAREFADRHGVPHAHGSYEALAADPAVDVVHVATPHVFHLDDALTCLEHRKAVLCEKALTINARQAER